MKKSIFIKDKDIETFLKPYGIKFENKGYGNRLIFKKENIEFSIFSSSLKEEIKTNDIVYHFGYLEIVVYDAECLKSEIELRNSFFKNLLTLLSKVLN